MMRSHASRDSSNTYQPRRIVPMGLAPILFRLAGRSIARNYVAGVNASASVLKSHRSISAPGPCARANSRHGVTPVWMSRPDHRSMATGVAAHAIHRRDATRRKRVASLRLFFPLQRLPTRCSCAFRLPALMAIPLRRSSSLRFS